MSQGQAPSGMRDQRSSSEAVAQESDQRSSSEAVAQESDQRSSSEAVAQQETRPARRCAFCETPFTPRMEAWMGDPQPCACCGGKVLGHWPIKAPVRDTDELKCDACGKVLYRAG